MTRPYDSGSGSNDGLPDLPPHLDPRGARRGGAPAPTNGGRRAARRSASGSSGRHGVLLATKALSALLSAALLLYLGYAWNTVRGLNRDAQRITVLVGGQHVDPKDPKKVITSYDIDGTAQNILIAGNDDRSNMTLKQIRELKVGRDGGSLNTDTMMIIHVPADGSKATIISLPRDSYVKIPGYGMNRLNAAYADGYTNSSGDTNAKRAAGANLLIQTVENLTGLNIDHFVLVSLMGFVTISDAIGGVPINLCSNVNDTVAYNRAEGSDGGSGFKMSKGHHVIKGVTALEFVRQRHNLPNGDIDRTARQRYFLTAAFRKVASAGTLLNPGRLSNLINAVNKSVWVDSGLNMLDLAKQMSNLSANNIEGKAIRFQYFWHNSPVGDVEKIDPAQVKAFVQKLIGNTDSAYTSAQPVDPSQVSVQVFNGGAASGTATRAANTLSNAGFKANVGGNSDSVSNTVIRYPDGDEAQAKTLAQYVPGAATEKTSTVSGVVLVLAGDGVGVHAKPAVSTPKKPSTHKTKKPRKALDSGCIN